MRRGTFGAASFTLLLILQVGVIATGYWKTIWLIPAGIMLLAATAIVARRIGTIYRNDGRRPRVLYGVLGLVAVRLGGWWLSLPAGERVWGNPGAGAMLMLAVGCAWFILWTEGEFRWGHPVSIG